MRYTLTIEADRQGHYAQLHTPLGELHYISRPFADPESAKQAARDWAARYLAELEEGDIEPREYLTNRDPGDETSQ